MKAINVLLVDDEYFNFEMLELALGSKFKLLYVDSGKKALDYSVASPPDVILLDVCMPGIDGYDTCRLLKNTPETNHIPIIMVSGLESEDDKNEAYSSGCDEYVTKPFNMAELVGKLEQFSN